VSERESWGTAESVLKGAGYVGSEQLGLNVFTFGETFF